MSRKSRGHEIGPEETGPGADTDDSGEDRPGGTSLEELPEAEVLLVELEAAREEIASLNDRLLRLAAEFDNYRKRTVREREDQRLQAQAEIVRAVIPALDDLARWRDLPNETTSVEALDHGLELILRNLEKALAEHGVARVDVDDVPFDPEVHQALRVEPAEREEEDETVGRVLAPGYTLRGLLVRPAQVEVLRWEGPA